MDINTSFQTSIDNLNNRIDTLENSQTSIDNLNNRIDTLQNCVLNAVEFGAQTSDWRGVHDILLTCLQS